MTNLAHVASEGQWSGTLSPREREVARLVVAGLSNKEVARKLCLAEGTVKLHLHKIFQKLGAKNRYSLILTKFPDQGR
jgi:two-component system nitrate/nitrite response regulator NarP